MAEYRVAVQQSLPALDVLYRGMELFGSRPYRAREVIAKELVECDLYLGILAHRYGSLDPETGLSFTEGEFRIAQREGIPAIFFMIDPDQRVLKDSIETDTAARRKLAEFQAEVSRETIFETFTTPEDLVGKVGRSLQRWLDENERKWQQLVHVPLNGWENDYIRKLYSADSAEVVYAISRLHRVDCRPAYEHFYAVLHRQDLPQEVAREIFRELKFSYDDERTCEMLLNIIDDLCRFRPLAINAIGERATLPERVLTKAAIQGVMRLATDTDDDVRYEVAHALGKIGAHRVEYLVECRLTLQTLTNDSAVKVRERSNTSLQRLPHSQRGHVMG